MKKNISITVLIENTAEVSALTAEHGLSLYIETPNHALLSDCGASSAFLDNAQKLGIDIKSVDTVILSHGHYDHSGGIMPFAEVNKKAKIYMRRSAAGEHYHGERYIGIDRDILSLPQVVLIESEKVLESIDEELSVFSGIKGTRFLPKGNSELTRLENGKNMPDDFSHEQCLVIKRGGGNILISGCAHNGILNILDRYRELYHDTPSVVISGFHMMKKTEHDADDIEIIKETARELAKADTIYYTGHCTGQLAFDIMKEIMGEKLRPLHTGRKIKIY